jgi:uncharacterized OB-fold protein
MADPTSNPRPLPAPTADSTPYWQAANAGKLVVQHCKACGRRQFYPRAFCTACLSPELEWSECSGLGRIYTYTICRIPGHPSMAAKVPYAVAMIDLDEGVRMLTNIVDCDIGNIAIGARVGVCYERISEEFNLPQFTLYPVEQA